MTDAPRGAGGAGAGEVEFWFEFGSHYSYLAVMRIEAAAAAHGVRIAWKPFLLGPIFRAFGWETSPFVLQKEKGEYSMRDLERQCRRHGLAWRRPSRFPRAALLPMRVAILGAQDPWLPAFCRRIMSMNFAEDREIDSVEAVAEALAGLGINPQPIVAQARSDANKLRLREQTEAARARGIFGAPTFFAGGEMFWGHDRMEEALQWCREPLRAETPR